MPASKMGVASPGVLGVPAPITPPAPAPIPAPIHPSFSRLRRILTSRTLCLSNLASLAPRTKRRGGLQTSSCSVALLNRHRTWRRALTEMGVPRLRLSTACQSPTWVWAEAGVCDCACAFDARSNAASIEETIRRGCLAGTSAWTTLQPVRKNLRNLLRSMLPSELCVPAKAICNPDPRRERKEKARIKREAPQDPLLVHGMLRTED